MRHPAYADEILEVPGHELRSIVGDHPGMLTGILFASPLDDRLHVSFLHGLADLPVNDESAITVEDAAQEEEGPADIEVRDVDVPVLMWPQGLLEALPFAGWSLPSRSQLVGRFEHAVNARRADGHDISVDHHVRQPPVTVQGMEIMEGDDGRLLPVLQPEVVRDATVVLIGRPQTPAPAVELAAGQSRPSQ